MFWKDGSLSLACLTTCFLYIATTQFGSLGKDAGLHAAFNSPIREFSLSAFPRGMLNSFLLCDGGLN